MRAHAASLFLSDFDGTIVENKAARGGSFQTPIVLYRINERKFPHDPLPDGPETIEIRPDDFERIKDYMPGGKFPHSINRTFTLFDGSKINPAQYQLIVPDSFMHYNDRNWNENQVIEDFRSAEKEAAENPEKTFKGPTWNLITELLAHPNGSAIVGVNTARSIPLEKLFELWQAEGHIQYQPNSRMIFGVGGHKFDYLGKPNDIVTRKMNLLKQIATEFRRVHLTQDDYVLDPNGKGFGYYHTFVFVDDTQTMVEGALELFSALAQSRQYPIKFVLGNAGLDSEVRATKRPRWVVITSDGGIRAANEIEIRAEAQFLKQKYPYEEKYEKVMQQYCWSVFSRGGR